MKGTKKLESIVKGVWNVVSNPREHAIEIYLGLLVGAAVVSGTVAGTQELYKFMRRDQLAREYGMRVAVEVGYGHPEHVLRATHFDPPYGQEHRQCGESFILALVDGTQLRYEVICSYELKETQLGDY